MNATDDAGRRWAARLCQLGAWSRELRQQAGGCDAALEELPSASSQAELVFTGTRDLLNFAADQVDQTAEALRMILEILDHVGESPRKTTRNRTRSDIMIGGMKQVIATTKNGATLTPEQLADAGVEPGERAVIEIRPYSEDEWIAETEGKVLSTEEFIEHLRRAPGPK